jgi:hypothetical protein
LPSRRRAAQAAQAAQASQATQANRSAASALPTDESEPEHRGYAWYHYLILILVAFVMGVLLWQLLNSDAPEAGAAPALEDVQSTIVAAHAEGLAW